MIITNIYPPGSIKLWHIADGIIFAPCVNHHLVDEPGEPVELISREELDEDRLTMSIFYQFVLIEHGNDHLADEPVTRHISGYPTPHRCEIVDRHILPINSMADFPTRKEVLVDYPSGIN